MSTLDIHRGTVAYMICHTCYAEAFSWMAAAFACPFCGGTEYMFPMFSDLDTVDQDDHDQNKVDVISHGRIEKRLLADARTLKRKRAVSDDGTKSI